MNKAPSKQRQLRCRQSPRRQFVKQASFALAGLFTSMSAKPVLAKTYLSIDQAKMVLLPGRELQKTDVEFTKEQKKSIQRASNVRVRSNTLNAWKSLDHEWFIVDQIIGKHENIDMAFAIDAKGQIMGLEVLTYRESYGHQIRIPKWRAQFVGKSSKDHLKLDQQIRNISGATLSCAHVTDGVNRLTQTWQLVLKDL
ncbi:MAG: Na+-translocating ferredoxin:NAD+ oxidoreductase RnfG subunit [Cryomorphaceae bacterium]|jgi:Na+-translocating ferredoxin:NAD+ oxidoreductase RnfG subunit